MDVTNRALIVSGALVWIFLVLVVILLAWGAPDESIEQLGDLVAFMEDHNGTEARLMITFGGLILVLLAVIVTIYEVAPPESGKLKMRQVDGGEATVGTDEVAKWLEEDLRAMAQIREVEATVQARGDKATLTLDLHVGAEADLTATTQEACRRAQKFMEERIGVTLARSPQASLHYRELQVAKSPESPALVPGGRASAPSSALSTPTQPQPPSPVSKEWQRPGTTAEESTQADPAAGPPSGAQSADETSETAQEDRPTGA